MVKRIAYMWLSASLLAGFLALSAPAQDKSLGDYARSIRKQKAQKKADIKEFDNENMPKADTVSVVGPTPAQLSNPTSSESAGKPDESAEASAPKDPSAPQNASPGKNADEERQKTNKEWQQKIAAQKAQIALTQRELDVLQREYRLRAAAMYADAGNRLRNQAEWDKEDADNKKKISAKQKALDDAKQQLEDMQEEARKAGVPSSMRE
jgi:hypothetical protein